ncbi:hypothetical protein M3603_11070 [Rummeliibacillus stabekisii]|uniref:hypothetical protein n=1 Tax=Rummeliibacillus stabekisii TaxID=241244 RepID=UPI002041330E|nr:hypothetical protein [Rummeliibacillus stabekisii]MCM3317187.1 hypothetical protein [Rummeliibacillus stabekisii]
MTAERLVIEVNLIKDRMETFKLGKISLATLCSIADPVLNLVKKINERDSLDITTAAFGMIGALSMVLRMNSQKVKPLTYADIMDKKFNY